MIKCASFGGNLSSKTFKCHISLMIYCRTHASHVSSVVNDLWSQIYAPLRPRQHTMAANEGVTKSIASLFRDDSDIVFLSIYVSILYLPTFSESDAWDFHLVVTEISGNVPATSEDFRRISEDFRTLPKIKCPQMFPKTFEHFQSYLKDNTFSVLWYDFVIIQKRAQSHHVLRTICQDLWVRREKLSLMRDIDVFSPQA